MNEDLTQAQRLKALVDKAETLFAAQPQKGGDAAELDAAMAEIERLEAALARAEQERDRELSMRREAADALDAAIAELKLTADA